jgi:hypothetical protein
MLYISEKINIILLSMSYTIDSLRKSLKTMELLPSPESLIKPDVCNVMSMKNKDFRGLNREWNNWEKIGSKKSLKKLNFREPSPPNFCYEIT